MNRFNLNKLRIIFKNTHEKYSISKYIAGFRARASGLK